MGFFCFTIRYKWTNYLLSTLFSRMKNNKLFTQVYFCNSFTPLYTYFSILLYYICCFLQTTVSVYLYYGMCVYPVTSISLCINIHFLILIFQDFYLTKFIYLQLKAFSLCPLFQNQSGFSESRKINFLLQLLSYEILCIWVYYGEKPFIINIFCESSCFPDSLWYLHPTPEWAKILNNELSVIL